MSISTLVIIALLSQSSAVLSTCVYTHPNGYSLRWLVLGENVLFKLENSNISANEYTGVGFGEATGNDMDRIIVQLNNSGVSVFELSSYLMDSTPHSCNDGSLITLDRRYKNRKIQADFSRPIITNSSNLNACQTWNFITAPTKIGDGAYYVNSTNSNSLQVCNVAEECDVLKMMNATISPSPVPEHPEQGPFREPQAVASSSGLTPSFPRTTYPAILPLEPLQLLIFERMLRKKRQSGYTPTNNIYGYDYNSSPTSPSEAARLVLNPNYAYLNDALSEGYARNYVQAETQYSQSGQVGGQAGGYKAYDAVPNQSAILSNEQQNAINYQQIRQNNPGSFNTPAYSGNYYGGALADAPQRAVSQGGFQQPASNNFVRPSYASATSLGYSSSSPAPYQSVVDLKTTRLRDPTAQAYYSDVSSTGNAQAMYYPYRTPTTVQSYSNNAQSYGISAQSLAGNVVYRDAATNPCSLEDPYWCDYYVRIYMNSSITLSGYGKQTVCQSLKQSLQDSYNGCCHAVQAAGCV